LQQKVEKLFNKILMLIERYKHYNQEDDIEYEIDDSLIDLETEINSLAESTLFNFYNLSFESFKKIFERKITQFIMFLSLK
jgi:hypothetical protein